VPDNSTGPPQFLPTRSQRSARREPLHDLDLFTVEARGDLGPISDAVKSLADVLVLAASSVVVKLSIGERLTVLATRTPRRIEPGPRIGPPLVYCTMWSKIWR
jgi:hypothetical protein